MIKKLKNKSLLTDKAYVNGAWVSASDSFEVLNPATGCVVGRVPDMGVADVRSAIENADKALPSWSGLSAKERAVILRRWADLCVEHADDLAMIMTWEQGKPIPEARGEVLYGAAFLEWYGEEGKRAYGDIIPSPIKGARMAVIKQPIGVCAMITPWNFPSAMITRKVGPALAAGCSVVVRPASETPLSALALGVLAQEAGVPAGVVNIVTGKDSRGIGKELCDNPIIKKLSFTGSTPVGKILMQQCASSVKKVSMELGGNAPFIVFEDADIDAAVEGAMVCKYRNVGQTCVCANRLYIHEAVYDEFLEKLKARVSELKVGDGIGDDITIGPMINEAAVQKVQSLVDDAIDKGADLVAGGAPHEMGGSFYRPTILGNVSSDMEIANEEIFGPVATLFKFKDEDDVIQKANDTEYGLAAYFYARDMGRVWRVAEALEYGMVAVNAGVLSTEVAPFGGIKESGIGREGSRYGLDEYLEMKYILMAGIS